MVVVYVWGVCFYGFSIEFFSFFVLVELIDIFVSMVLGSLEILVISI